MNVIYHCFGGAHSSVVAAAIHLNQLPHKRTPTTAEIMRCAYFDKVNSNKHGLIHLLGRDEMGNRIYNLGCRGADQIVKNAINGTLNVYSISNRELLFVNTLPCVDLKMRLGGYLSRRWGLVNKGRPLVIKGIKDNYSKFTDLVANTKNKLKEGDSN